MNDAMRKRIADLKLSEISEALDDLLAQEEGVDGRRGHWNVKQALSEASQSLAEVDYLATTPRANWD